MVLGVCQMELEALQLQTATDGQSCTVGTAALAFADFHLVGTSEVIASGNVDVLAEEHVSTKRKVIDEATFPFVQP